MQGPEITRLVHHMAECPDDFLASPRQGKSGIVYVDAVVSDIVCLLGGSPLGFPEGKPFRIRGANNRNYLRIVLVSCWLLYYKWFRQQQRFAKAAFEWLANGFNGLEKLISAELFVTDPDRREELARLCLSALDLRPMGETEHQAADRLKTLDSVERARVIERSKKRQERARRIREAMRREQAVQAAARYSRE